MKILSQFKKQIKMWSIISLARDMAHWLIILTDFSKDFGSVPKRCSSGTSGFLYKYRTWKLMQTHKQTFKH